MAERSEVAILKEYFGMLPGQSLADFAAEVKKLSVDEKHELASLAAIELGHTLKTT
jgi:hypothetical protein